MILESWLSRNPTTSKPAKQVQGRSSLPASQEKPNRATRTTPAGSGLCSSEERRDALPFPRAGEAPFRVEEEQLARDREARERRLLEREQRANEIELEEHRERVIRFRRPKHARELPCEEVLRGGRESCDRRSISLFSHRRSDREHRTRDQFHPFGRRQHGHRLLPAFDHACARKPLRESVREGLPHTREPRRTIEL